MNPVVLNLGPLSLRAFTLPIALAVIFAGCILALTAIRRGEKVMRWLDVGLIMLVFAVIGARIAHIAIELPYFREDPGRVWDLNGGGFAWQGGAIGSILGAMIGCAIRRVPFKSMAELGAIFLPMFGLSVWNGCGGAVCAYGAEVRTLADYPALIVLESPDVIGIVAPRLNLPLIGAAFSIVVLLVALGLTRISRLDEVRFPIVFAIYAIGAFALDFYRGDYVPVWFGLRADQIYSLALLPVAIAFAAAVKLRRSRRPAVQPAIMSDQS